MIEGYSFISSYALQIGCHLIYQFLFRYKWQISACAANKYQIDKQASYTGVELSLVKKMISRAFGP